MRSLLAVLIAVVAVGFACEPGEEPTETTSASNRGGESSSNCPEAEGRRIRGRVLVPVLSEEGADSGLENRRGPGGRLERPAKEVDISVYAVGSEEVLAEATTDASGRWCVVLPSGREVGTELVAEATIAEKGYRRAIVAEHGQNISVRSEALHRVLASKDSSNGTDISSLPPAVYLNLETVASTAADLVDPTGWQRGATLASAPERLEAQLMENERFLEQLDRLGIDR